MDYRYLQKTGSQCREPGCPRTAIAIFIERSSGRHRQLCGQCGEFRAAAGWFFSDFTEWRDDFIQQLEARQEHQRGLRQRRDIRP